MVVAERSAARRQTRSNPAWRSGARPKASRFAAPSTPTPSVPTSSGSAPTPVKPGSSPFATERSSRARTEWNNIEHMIQEVVEPFGQWVQANHPDDFAVMYIDGNPTDFRLSEAAVRLWEQHLGEYVAEQTDELDAAEAFMAAWADGDGDDVAALLARRRDLGGLRPPTRSEVFTTGTEPWAGRIRTEECVQRPVLQQIGCSYTLENDLSRFFGADPEAESFAFDIAAGEIDDGAGHLRRPRGRRLGARSTSGSQTTTPPTSSGCTPPIPGLPSGMRPRSDCGSGTSHDFVASSDGYIARAESICTAAHARFNDEMAAAGIDMEPSPDDDGSGLQLIPSNAEDIPAAEEVSRARRARGPDRAVRGPDTRGRAARVRRRLPPARAVLRRQRGDRPGGPLAAGSRPGTRPRPLHVSADDLAGRVPPLGTTSSSSQRQPNRGARPKRRIT